MSRRRGRPKGGKMIDLGDGMIFTRSEFLKQIKIRPAIYNNVFLSAHERQQQWKDIAQALTNTSDVNIASALKLKWTRERENFVKHYKTHIVNNMRQQTKTLSPRLREMDFLIKYIKLGSRAPQTPMSEIEKELEIKKESEMKRESERQRSIIKKTSYKEDTDFEVDNMQESSSDNEFRIHYSDESNDHIVSIKKENRDDESEDALNTMTCSKDQINIDGTNNTNIMKGQLETWSDVSKCMNESTQQTSSGGSIKNITTDNNKMATENVRQFQRQSLSSFDAVDVLFKHVTNCEDV